jgi:hypothetical protein
VRGRRSPDPAVSSAPIRVARACRVAGRRLRVGQQPLDQGPPGAMIRPFRQQPQRRRVIARRGRGRRRLELSSGGVEQVDRARVSGPRRVLDVVGEPHRPGPATPERVCGPRMRAQPPAARGGHVDGVAHHRMAEREPARSTARPHQRVCEQLVERAQRGRVGQLGHRGGQVGVERVTGDGRGFEHGPGLGRQVSELGGQRGGDRRGDRAVGHDVAAAGRRLARAGELLEVERVAARLAVDRRRGVPDELCRVRLAERTRLQARHARLAHGAGERRGERCGQLSLARCQGEQHGGGGRPPHQRRERVQRCRVGPVHVVEAQDQRSCSRPALELLAQRSVRAVAV